MVVAEPCHAPAWTGHECAAKLASSARSSHSSKPRSGSDRYSWVYEASAVSRVGGVCHQYRGGFEVASTSAWSVLAKDQKPLGLLKSLAPTTEGYGYFSGRTPRGFENLFRIRLGAAKVEALYSKRRSALSRAASSSDTRTERFRISLRIDSITRWSN